MSFLWLSAVDLGENKQLAKVRYPSSNLPVKASTTISQQLQRLSFLALMGKFLTNILDLVTYDSDVRNARKGTNLSDQKVRLI